MAASGTRAHPDRDCRDTVNSMKYGERELDGVIEALSRDAKLLIGALGVDISRVASHTKGALRYQKVSNALDQLTYAEKQSGTSWEDTTAPNGRNGTYLVKE